MKTNLINYPSINFILVVLSFIIFNCYADCPIQYYPTQTIIGFINAEINNDPQKHNQQETYTYTMIQSLSTATPDVLIGVNALQLEAKRNLRFRVLFQPTPRFGTLNFKILLNQTNNLWKRLQFNFIATNNPMMQANVINFASLPQNVTRSRHTLVSTIQIQNNIRISKPIIQTYICGISIRSRASQADLQNALRQIQSLRRFSWNLNLIRSLNQRIITQSIINYEIISSTLSNNSLSVQINVSNESAILEGVTISYIVINSIEFPLQNNLLNHSFALSAQVSNFRFIPLSNKEFTFLGIRGMQYRINSFLQFDFIVSITGTSFSIATTKALNEDSFLYVSDIQMEIKKEFQCQNCPESIYRFQTYCLANCPRGYANLKNGTSSNCKLCNISQFLIPNKNLNDCQCAKQYFLSPQTKQCEICHYSCLTCSNNLECTSCDALQITTKRIYNQKSKQCDCSPGYFDNNQNLLCQECHYSCQTCKGASIHQCIKCEKGRSFDSTNKCVCGINFVQNSLNQCVCKQPNVLVDNSCYSKIIASTLCSKPNMVELKALNGQIYCDCAKGYFMYQNDCVSCPDTFVLNYMTGKCQCSSTSYLNSNGICISCESMKYYDSKYDKCLCRKQFFEKQDGSCVDCPDKSTYVNGNCQCVFNYYFKNGTCIKCNKTQDNINCLRVKSDQL